MIDGVQGLVNQAPARGGEPTGGDGCPRLAQARARRTAFDASADSATQPQARQVPMCVIVVDQGSQRCG